MTSNEIQEYHLSPDIWLEVLEFCSPSDLCNLAITCKSLGGIASSDAAWKRFFLQLYGNEIDCEFKTCLLERNRKYSQIRANRRKQAVIFKVFMRSRYPSKWNFHMQTIVCGTKQCGKTSLLKSIGTDNGRDFYTIEERADDDYPIKYWMWDAYSDIAYRKPDAVIMQGAKSVILCFDICDMKSFESLESFVTALKTYNDNLDDVAIVVAGLKLDRGNFRQVSYRQAEEIASALGAFYVEVSAFTTDNLKTLIDAMVAKTLSKYMDSIMELEHKQTHPEKRRSRSCNVM